MSAREISLGSFVRANGLMYADRPALIEDNRIISHGLLDRRTNRLARTLLSHGVGAGDRFALLLPDGIEFMELLIAAGKIGAIATLLNWRLAPAEIEGLLEDSAPKAIYYAEQFSGLVASLPQMHCFSVAGEPRSSASYEAWVTQGPDTPTGYRSQSATALFMMFTSGTTGKPKGCVHGHGSTMIQALGFAGRRGLSRDDVNLSTNPLFHVAGLGHAMAMLAVGGATCFVDRQAGPEAPLEMTAKHRVTLATLSMPLLEARQQANGKFDDRLGFRKLTGGAGMSDPRQFAFVADEWRALLTGGYGQTESWGFVTFIDYPDMLEHPTSIGWPLQHIDAAILDSNGLPIDDPDAEGELGINGPNVMLGYWNNQQATQEALGTGWLRTGDMVRRDHRGLLYIQGRMKELIKSGGENVYPAEVEAVLSALAGIADVAVAGVKDAKWGEAVKAFIVLEAGAEFSVDAMITRCRASIAGYKRPRYVEFLDVIPRDPLGKVRRYQLSARPVSLDQEIS